MVLAQHLCIVCNLGAEQNGFGPTFLHSLHLGAEQNGFGPTFWHSLQRLVKKGIATKSLPAAEVRERVYILTNML
jgi:hypothetical protein